MAAEIADCRPIARKIIDQAKEGLGSVRKEIGLAPVVIGQNPDIESYLKAKRRVCEETNIRFLFSEDDRLPENASGNEIAESIEKLNERADVAGIMVELPLPKVLQEETDEILEKISYKKDAEGLGYFHRTQLKRKRYNQDLVAPCTAKAVMALLDEYHVLLVGRKAAIINDSRIIGKPLRRMVKSRGAEVKMCNEWTLDVDRYISTADIVVSAVGRENFRISGKKLKRGCIAIDVAYRAGGDGKVYGDFEEDAKDYAGLFAPVNSGLGRLTTAFVPYNMGLLMEMRG